MYKKMFLGIYGENRLQLAIGIVNIVYNVYVFNCIVLILQRTIC